MAEKIVVVNKGWIDTNKLVSLFPVLRDKGTSYSMLFCEMTALQTFRLVFSVSETDLDEFIEVISSNLKLKDRNIEIL